MELGEHYLTGWGIKMTVQKTGKASVRLDIYKEAYRKDLENYYLTKEQIIYSGLPVDSIRICEQDNERYPVVILCEGIPAGFLVLHGWGGVREYSQNRSALLLRAFSINNAFQGKGIATTALLALDSFIKEHFSNRNEVLLAVNHKNLIAQHVYQKAGFIDKGKRAIGKHGEMFLLYKPLA